MRIRSDVCAYSRTEATSPPAAGHKCTVNDPPSPKPRDARPRHQDAVAAAAVVMMPAARAPLLLAVVQLTNCIVAMANGLPAPLLHRLGFASSVAMATRTCSAAVRERRASSADGRIALCPPCRLDDDFPRVRVKDTTADRWPSPVRQR